MSSTGITAQQLWFTAPGQVEVRTLLLEAPAAGMMLVAVKCSAVSAGTELLVYRGLLPDHMTLDATLPGMQHNANYPLQYGYASVGEVVNIGAGVAAHWLGQRVFAFQPHASHFVAEPAQVIAVPDDISTEAALFLANMETAVNLVQDGNPQLGEHAVVLGQGIVGVLLLQVLRQFPLASLNAIDATVARRQRAEALGAHAVADPADPQALAGLMQQLGQRGADLVFEVSGVPDALNLAISLAGFASRIVIGSWYGSKSAQIALGGAAHRNRLQLITSQVSTVAPALSGRWDKSRRFTLAWELIRQLRPQQWIGERVELAAAASLYQRLHQQQQAASSAHDVLQAVFVYDN